MAFAQLLLFGFGILQAILVYGHGLAHHHCLTTSILERMNQFCLPYNTSGHSDLNRINNDISILNLAQLEVYRMSFLFFETIDYFVLFCDFHIESEL